MKTLTRLFACVAILAAAQMFALAQAGQQVGYTVTDFDFDGIDANNPVYRINLTTGVTEQLGITNTTSELEGLFSIDGPTRSTLFGVGENCETTCTTESVLVNLTAPATSTTSTGTVIGTGTGIEFGTEAGSAYDYNNSIAYTVASDDRNVIVDGQQYPASRLYTNNVSDGTASPVVCNIDGVEISVTEGVYVDSLAYGGDGNLYATDFRLTDSLYKYNFSNCQFERIGYLADPENENPDLRGEKLLSEDSGLATYFVANEDGTRGSWTLYAITEGDGASRKGRLWTINPSASVNAATYVADIVDSVGNDIPEDLEGFEIPFLPVGTEPEP